MATKAKEPTAKYEVVHTPLLHDGILYQPGKTDEPVELTERQAQRQASNVTKVDGDKPNA